MRLQQIHPALVHYPLALLPTSLAADAVGRATGSKVLMSMGGLLMTAAAATAAAAGVAGLVAQESSRISDEAHPYLVTHRNLNFVLILGVGSLAATRAKVERPGRGYLLAGAAALGGMLYTAYLGGEMVYKYGVGIEPAGGVDEDEAVEVRPGTFVQALAVAGHQIAEGARHTVSHIREGEIAPLLTGKAGKTSGRGPEGDQNEDRFHHSDSDGFDGDDRGQSPTDR